MVKAKEKPNKLAYIFYEGYTEKIFYRRIEKIEAIIMIESWFFYDLKGICDYIGLPYTDNLKRTYSSPERLTHRDLQKLFRKGTNKQHYIKGEKSFLEKLDIDKIYRNCSVLNYDIYMIRRDFEMK